ncbi:MAG: SCO family protein [Vicingaceae bacterium]
MKNKLAIIIPALLLMVGIGIAYQMIKSDRSLPIYSPMMINPELVDESKQDVKKNHRIADFSLIDQDGNAFTQEQLADKYYVTDFFFTTCPTICPDMSSQLMRVQEAYEEDGDFMIVSHSVTPETDTPEILKEYANRYEAKENKWVFLTGDKKTIYDLARKSYFAATTEGDGGLDDFIHTENFVLVDKEKRIRGFYDGTDPKSVDQLITDIEILQAEYQP